MIGSNVQKAFGLRAYDKGNLILGDKAQVFLVSDVGSAIKAYTKSTITLQGAADVASTSGTAITSVDEGSLVDLSASGAKHVTGDLVSKDKGSILLTMDTADSLLKGNSFIKKGDSEDISAATTNIAMRSGARWLMTKDSDVTTLSHNSGATVDMTTAGGYVNLHAANYSGKGGVFRLKTDLASETEGDKIWIDNAEKGASGLIEVQDKSLLQGKDVQGHKHLLVATDASANATFSGKNINNGGLWEYTPTIENGQNVKDENGNVIGTKDQWYLTSMGRKVNEDTKALVSAGNNEYAFYRMHLDTLRQRLGDVRDRDPQDKDVNLWARQQGGSYEGKGLSNKYHIFQLGGDWAANRKSTYGAFFERGIASGSMDHGSEKNHSLAGAAYGLWLGDDGSYTDVIAKVGRHDMTLHTYGPYPDKGDYRGRYASLSAEYGKTMDIGSGWYVEPQGQLVVGRLDDIAYTTDRGTRMHADGYTSTIGRLGFLIGRKHKGNLPYDYYLKANVYHEFGGDRDFALRAANGDAMNGTFEGFKSTWYDTGLGGTWKLSKSMYAYGDVTRSFGGGLHEKWRWNVGVNWAF